MPVYTWAAEEQSEETILEVGDIQENEEIPVIDDTREESDFSVDSMDDFQSAALQTDDRFDDTEGNSDNNSYV